MINKHGTIIVILLGLPLSEVQSQLLFSDNDIIMQDSDTFNESRQLDALFGSALAARGNKLVIGAPKALVNGEKAGAVYIRSAGWQGIFTHSNPVRKFSQNSSGIPGDAEEGDHFGFSVAIGNFGFYSDLECNYDGLDLCLGYQDVIAGVPYERLNGEANGGMANIVEPGSLGCDESDACGALTQLHQDNELVGTAEEGDVFGFSLAVGDFNNDGAEDLAVGVPGEAVNSNLATQAGGVNVILGRPYYGLRSGSDEFFSQSSLAGGARDDENFAYSLAAGDFDGDGVDDLAVGVPGDVQTDGANRTGGGINVIYGKQQTSLNLGGLSLSGNENFHQDSDGITGLSEDGDRFGFSLASGNFNGDNYDDLAIGVPYERVNDVNNAGAVVIMYGSSSGLRANGNHSIHQGTSGVNGSLEPSDLFGHTLAAGDFNNDGVDDLAVGIPYEDVLDVTDAGGVALFFGVDGGRLNGVNNDVFFSQYDLAFPAALAQNTRFGYSLAVGDFDVNGKDDLAVGTYGNLSNVNAINGSVAVIYQRPEPFIDLIFEQGFEAEQNIN